MDNLTHSLVGLTAAKAGLEKLSPGATVLCVLAANAPDADIVVLAFGDRWDFLQHHRGITHAVVGVITLAILLPLIFYAFDRLAARFRSRPPATRLKGLMLASFIVSATHPLLDWTNNYGIRFFLPWSQKWSYGDLVFIVDPFLWLILGGAAFLLTTRTKVSKVIWAVLAAMLSLLVMTRGDMLPNLRLFALIWIFMLVTLIVLFLTGAGARWGSRIAFAAFALVLCYWTVLAFAHARALALGSEEAVRVASAHGEVIGRRAAMPRLANPLRWDYVFDTDRATYRFDVGVMNGSSFSDVIRYQKPTGETKAALDSISQQKPVRVFLGFARFPVLQLSDPDCVTRTLVQLADLRYTEPGSSRGNFSLEVPVDCPTNEQSGK